MRPVIELDQTSNQLKFLSQKQGVILIKNLLVGVQSHSEEKRWLQQSIEREAIIAGWCQAVETMRQRKKTPIYWATLGFMCCVHSKVLCSVHVYSCITYFFNNFSSMKLQKKLIDWLERWSHLDSELGISSDQTKLNWLSNARYISSAPSFLSLGFTDVCSLLKKKTKAKTFSLLKENLVS